MTPQPAARDLDTKPPVPFEEWLSAHLVRAKLAGKYPWVMDIVGVSETDDWADIITRYIELLRDENRALGGHTHSPAAYRTAPAPGSAGDVRSAGG